MHVERVCADVYRVYACEPERVCDALGVSRGSVFMCICMCERVRECVYVYVCQCARMHMRESVYYMCMHARERVCMCLCRRERVCMHVRESVCVCM